MKLSLYEQETIILYNQAEATAERRKAASERAKAAGYRPPVPKAGGK